MSSMNNVLTNINSCTYTILFYRNTAITEQPLPSAPPAPTIVPVAPGVAPSNNQPSAPYIYANDPGWDWLFWCFICQNHSQTQPLNNAHEGCCTASDDQCCCGDYYDCASCHDGDNCCENDDCGCGDCCAAFGDFDCDF